jgi:hypothetical protein
MEDIEKFLGRYARVIDIESCVQSAELGRKAAEEDKKEADRG